MQAVIWHAKMEMCIRDSSKSMLYTEIGIGCLVFILINIPYDGANLIHLLAVIGLSLIHI